MHICSGQTPRCKFLQIDTSWDGSAMEKTITKLLKISNSGIKDQIGNPNGYLTNVSKGICRIMWPEIDEGIHTNERLSFLHMQ